MHRAPERPTRARIDVTLWLSAERKWLEAHPGPSRSSGTAPAFRICVACRHRSGMKAQGDPHHTVRVGKEFAAMTRQRTAPVFAPQRSPGSGHGRSGPRGTQAISRLRGLGRPLISRMATVRHAPDPTTPSGVPPGLYDQPGLSKSPSWLSRIRGRSSAHGPQSQRSVDGTRPPDAAGTPRAPPVV